MNDIMNNIVTFFNKLYKYNYEKGNRVVLNDKMSQFSIMNNITDDIVIDRKTHNIVNGSLPDGLLVKWWY